MEEDGKGWKRWKGKGMGHVRDGGGGGDKGGSSGDEMKRKV